jgi:hypothetical protein
MVFELRQINLSFFSIYLFLLTMVHHQHNFYVHVSSISLNMQIKMHSHILLILLNLMSININKNLHLKIVIKSIHKNRILNLSIKLNLEAFVSFCELDLCKLILYDFVSF